jgi:hypothetical protein
MVDIAQVLSPIVLIPAMTNRTAPDFKRMIGPASHMRLDLEGTHP